MELSVTSNVPLTGVQFYLINPKTGARQAIAGGNDPGAKYTWTPAAEGQWHLQAEGTTAAGQRVTSEGVPFRVYLGELYVARPVVEKDKFLDLASSLASQSWQICRPPPDGPGHFGNGLARVCPWTNTQASSPSISWHQGTVLPARLFPTPASTTARPTGSPTSGPTTASRRAGPTGELLLTASHTNPSGGDARQHQPGSGPAMPPILGTLKLMDIIRYDHRSWMR